MSLLTTAGYTTSESEDVVTSNIRRKVAMVAMFFGYMFSVVIASSIINIAIGFESTNKLSNVVNIVVIALAVIGIFFITRSKRVTRFINNIIKGRIEKFISLKQKVNPLYVIDTHGKFVVCEVLITRVPEDLKDKTLMQAEVRKKYDVSVLTLKRGHEVRTMSANKDILKSGDRVILFGYLQNIKTLFQSDIL